VLPHVRDQVRRLAEGLAAHHALVRLLACERKRVISIFCIFYSSTKKLAGDHSLEIIAGQSHRPVYYKVSKSIILHFGRKVAVVGLAPGPNPTITSFNASIVKTQLIAYIHSAFFFQDVTTL
jgi:hypothetical protein